MNAEPNVAELAGIKFSVADERRKGVETSEYRPRRDLSKDVAVETLKAKGLKEGKHFTAATKGAKRYEIRITDGAYAKAVEALEVECFGRGMKICEE
nr:MULTISPECIES: PaRep2b protein [Pyrobaculum]